MRKDGITPYLIHPLRVAGAASVHPEGSPTLVAAAWLHDTIEDTDTTHDELVRRFGPGVGDLVLELTNVFSKENHPDKNRRERRRLEFERLADASSRAKLIKLLDRRDNIQDAPGSKVDFLRIYAGETRDLLGAVGDADPVIRDEIFAAVEHLETRLMEMADRR